MSRIIQIAALAVALGFFIAAEVAAELLAIHPASAALWWLNLEVFGLVRFLSSPVSPVRFLFTPAWPLFALSAFLILAVASRPNCRFVLAAATNVCFAVAASLALLGFAGDEGRSTAAIVPVPLEWDTLTGTLLTLALAAACLASHISYWGYLSRRR
ncbi:hypothetical protein [Alsobacter sp. R-9]